MRALILTLAGMSLGTSLVAQGGTGNTANPAVSTHHRIWEIFTNYITTVAEETPESTYAFRPSKDVRTLGQFIGHIADAHYLFCAAAMGDKPREESFEKSRTKKSDLVSALKTSTEYCARAYKQTDKAALQPTKLFGEERTRLFALGLNAAHNAEHYGNIVTYLRINGIVPPSSRQSS
jgi:uncharacterized damage-inducible protein DinB